MEINRDITLREYITAHWLPVLRKRVEPNTVGSYSTDARVHIPDDLKDQSLRTIRRGQLKQFLAGLGEDHRLAPASVAKVANVVRSIFSSALDDEVIETNPAEKIGRTLGLHQFNVENVRSMTGAELMTFLTVAREKQPAHYLELALLAYTGLRIGEARGLQIEDLDLPGRVVMVQRQVQDDGRVTGPKGRRGKRKTRAVDMADDLATLLSPYLLARNEYDLRMFRRTPWLLYPEFGESPTLGQVSTVTHRLRRCMKRVLVQAKLAPHFTPHCLRHTFARLLLERGEDLLYVARQLGDTLTITAEIYGRWARVPARAGGPNLLGRQLPTIR